MAENWDSYICNVNGELASIFVDLSLRQKAPDSTRPCLLFVWVKMHSPRPDGLSSQEEADVLWRLGSSLQTSLGKHLDAVFVGRVTTQGRREFYFYVPQVPLDSIAIDQALRSFSGYEYEIGTQEDSLWHQYLSVLYPSKEELQKIKNRQVLEVLQKNGDQLDQPREVSHWIYFRREADRDAFSHEMQELRYQIIPCKPDPQLPYPYGVQIRRVDRVDEESINDTVVETFRFAQASDGDYDGWETEVVRPPSPLRSLLKRVGLG